MHTVVRCGMDTKGGLGRELARVFTSNGTAVCLEGSVLCIGLYWSTFRSLFGAWGGGEATVDEGRGGRDQYQWYERAPHRVVVPQRTKCRVSKQQQERARHIRWWL